jgi:hypothetical protein
MVPVINHPLRRKQFIPNSLLDQASKITSRIMFLNFLFALVPAFVVAAQMGGWSPADVKSPEVMNAAVFALNTKYGGESPRHFEIEQAKKQVRTPHLHKIRYYVVTQC